MRTSRVRFAIRRMMIAEGLLIAAFLSAYILDRVGLLELRRSGLEGLLPGGTAGWQLIVYLLMVSTAGWYLIVSLLIVTVRALRTGRREMWQR
jgi:hypothetical protein